MNDPAIDKKIESRVSRVEAMTESLHGYVNQINGKLDSLMDRMNTTGRTNWGNVIAAASLTLTFGGLSLLPIYRTIGEQQDDFERTYKLLFDHITDGHPETQTQAIDENIQDIRELRDELKLLKQVVREQEGHIGRHDERIKFLEK